MDPLTCLPDGTPSDQLLGVLERDGAVVVTGLLPPEACRALHADMVREAAGVAPGTRSDHPLVQRFWGGSTKRFTRLAARSDHALAAILQPTLLAVADALLLPSCTGYWLNTAQLMAIGPGERAQGLHRDADNWRTMNRPDGFEVTVSCMYALSDFTDEVGATRVVPGSHRWPDYTQVPEDVVTLAAEMPAGSGLVYTGRVLHGGGANRTADQWRHGLHVSYVLGWLTPEEASPLGVGWERVRHLPERAQRLLGWRCYDADQDDGTRLWTVDYEDVPVGLGLE